MQQPDPYEYGLTGSELGSQPFRDQFETLDVGELHQVPNATFVVQRREWEADFDEEDAAKQHLPKRVFNLGHNAMQIDGDYDLIGYGSVTCIPTFGHTPGAPIIVRAKRVRR